MSVGGRTRVCQRRMLVGVVLVIAALAGCTYSEREPGLFDEDEPSPTPNPGVPTAPPPVHRSGPTPTNARLPLAGERSWTTTDGSELTFRIAVHTLRRMNDATVLDWSITTLPSGSLGYGDLIPATIPLGAADDPLSFRLIDGSAHRVYRPLRNDHTGCLCTTLGRLQVGVTALQQVVFPGLAADARVGRLLEVDIPTVALFTDVYAPPIGSAVRATDAPDLSRREEPAGAIRWTEAFTWPANSAQQLRIGIVSIRASERSTSVVWSIWNIGGASEHPKTAAPITDRVDSALSNQVASGLRLRLSRRTATGDVVVDELLPWRTGPVAKSECLCTDLRGWAELLPPSHRTVTVITNLPALPPGIETVDVALPGLTPLRRVDVESPADRPRLAITRAQPTAGWRAPHPYRIRAWPTSDWPTPMPDASMLAHFTGSSELLRRPET
ncbi:MAG TPA: hypothetical protein VIP98_01275 [Microlunatus sp.]